jgi:hypothetical protein
MSRRPTLVIAEQYHMEEICRQVPKVIVSTLQISLRHLSTGLAASKIERTVITQSNDH